MKITRLRTRHVLPRWLFLEIETDAGITGLGEPITEGQARVVETAVAQMGEYLLGQDPRRIQHHWQTLYRGAFYRGGAAWVSALSGIEQALWDIKGKALGVPVHELLGGAVRDTIRMYPHAATASPEASAASARERVAQGFTAMKISVDGPVRGLEGGGWVDAQVARFAAIRDAVGPDVEVAIDLHGRTTPAVAKVLIEELKAYRPMFVEEPCLPENVDAMADIARGTTVPLATGERVFTKWGFRELLAKRAVAVVQPDLCHAGGIFETRAIAAMAEAEYVSVAPHNPLGPISLAACLQVAAATPNFLIQEHPGLPDGRDLGVGLLRAPFVVSGGHVPTPTAPGLGIELDEDGVAASVYDGAWPSPLLFHEDGSIGDW